MSKDAPAFSSALADGTENPGPVAGLLHWEVTRRREAKHPFSTHMASVEKGSFDCGSSAKADEPSLRRKSFHHGDTEDTEFSFSMEFFSVISVPPWLIFIPMAGQKTHVTLRRTKLGRNAQNIATLSDANKEVTCKPLALNRLQRKSP
jgi:hypothetical protein